LRILKSGTGAIIHVLHGSLHPECISKIFFLIIILSHVGCFWPIFDVHLLNFFFAKDQRQEQFVINFFPFSKQKYDDIQLFSETIECTALRRIFKNFVC
jgi:hypothetical protein